MIYSNFNPWMYYPLNVTILMLAFTGRARVHAIIGFSVLAGAGYLFAIVGLKIMRVAPEGEIQKMPAEVAFRGVGRQRVSPTELEVMVREGG